MSKNNYNDNGQPHNYIFAVADTDGFLLVAVTPLDYWVQEGCQVDWDLKWRYPNFIFECAEAVYEVDTSSPGAPQNVQEVHNYLISTGMGYDPDFAIFMGNPPTGPAVIPTVPVATKKKLSTEFFKNYIVTELATDKRFSEIMCSYHPDEPRFGSLRNKKNWKRTLKRKGTIKSLAELAGDVFGDVFYQLENFLEGDWYGEIYDPTYFSSSNRNTKVVVREFVWADDPDEDTTISFVTDEFDTKIVAICYHID